MNYLTVLLIVACNIIVLKMIFLYRTIIWYLLQISVERLTSKEYNHSSFLSLQSTDPYVQVNEVCLILPRDIRFCDIMNQKKLPILTLGLSHL